MLSVSDNKVQENIKTKKIEYIEYLRIVACIAVIITHVSGDKLSSSEGF